MNPKKPHTKPQRGPSKGPMKHSRYNWYHRRWPYCPDWYDYNHDYEYDYDWDWDYTYDDYLDSRRMKAPSSRAWSEESDAQMAYQQGFKDGWKAAFEYMTYTECDVIPEPEPMSPPSGNTPDQPA